MTDRKKKPSFVVGCPLQNALHILRPFTYVMDNATSEQSVMNFIESIINNLNVEERSCLRDKMMNFVHMQMDNK